MDLMKFEWGTMLFQLVAFLILVLVVGRFALKPLLNMMASRTERVQAALAEAEAKRVEAVKYVEQQQAELAAARKEAQDFLATARSQAAQEQEAIVREAQGRAEQIVANAHQDIEREREIAKQKLLAGVSGLAVQLAGRVLNKEIDLEQHQRVLARCLEQVST